MRPIATEQNPLRNPLNRLLATEAQVRLLRVLCQVNGSLSVADAADRTGLTQVGARKALRRMVATGFVVRVGAGRDQQFRLRRKDPLTMALDALFKAEQSRYEGLLRALRQAFEESSSPPRSAWIREFPRELGEPLEIEWRSAHVVDGAAVSCRRFPQDGIIVQEGVQPAPHVAPMGHGRHQPIPPRIGQPATDRRDADQHGLRAERQPVFYRADDRDSAAESQDGLRRCPLLGSVEHTHDALSAITDDRVGGLGGHGAEVVVGEDQVARLGHG